MDQSYEEALKRAAKALASDLYEKDMSPGQRGRQQAIEMVLVGIIVYMVQIGKQVQVALGQDDELKRRIAEVLKKDPPEVMYDSLFAALVEMGKTQPRSERASKKPGLFVGLWRAILMIVGNAKNRGKEVSDIEAFVNANGRMLLLAREFRRDYEKDLHGSSDDSAN